MPDHDMSANTVSGNDDGGVPYRLDDWRGELDPRSADELFSTLSDRLRATGSVLDVGTGSGYVATALASYGVPVAAVDVVDWRASDVHIPFAFGDACALPVSSGSCDGVHMARMLGHVSDWRGALAELVRVLRPGGTLCLSLGGWLAPGPLREFEDAVVDEALRRGARRPTASADHNDATEVDAELVRLGTAGPELVEVAGTLVRSPREVVADVVGRHDRWKPDQDLALLYDAGGSVLRSATRDVDAAHTQQEHIEYRVYTKRP